MNKPVLHTGECGRFYWEHKPKEFMTDVVNSTSSFIESFGYCKKFKVLRIKFRKSEAHYQYHFVPIWIMRELKRYNNGRKINDLCGLYRQSIKGKFMYLQEGTVNETQMKLNF